MLFIYSSDGASSAIFFATAFLFFLPFVPLSAAGKELDFKHNPDAIHFSPPLTPIAISQHSGLRASLAPSSPASCRAAQLLALHHHPAVLHGRPPDLLWHCPLCYENIGNATANLAALGSYHNKPEAGGPGLVLFANVFGVVCALPVLTFVDAVRLLVGYDPTALVPLRHRRQSFRLCWVQRSIPALQCHQHLPAHLVHTPVIERIVCLIIKPKAAKTSGDFACASSRRHHENPRILLPYWKPKEIHFLLRRNLIECLEWCASCLGSKMARPSSNSFRSIEKYEGIAQHGDRDCQIFDQVSDAHLESDFDTKGEKVRAMLREISELESIETPATTWRASSAESVWAKEDEFTEDQHNHSHQMFELTDDVLSR